MKNKISLFIGLVLCWNGTTGQALADLLVLVNEANLETKILEKDYQIALEKIPQVGQRPDPEIGLGIYPLPVETRLGAQWTRLSATQMLPWFGVLDSQKDLAQAQANTLLPKVKIKQLDKQFLVKQAYYQLYELEQTQAILQENIVLYNSLENLALAKVETGTASAADVLKIQLKKKALEQKIRLLESNEQYPSIQINQILDRGLDTSIDVMEQLQFTELDFDKDTLLQHIKQQHPQMNVYDLQQESARQAMALNKLKAKPSLGVGVDYIYVRKRSDAEPTSNGRDIVQLRGSIKVPLNKDQYDAKEREEQLRITRIEEQKRHTSQQFLVAIEQAYTDAEIARLNMELYQEQIEITKGAIQILESDYSASGKGFDELLEHHQALVNYEVQIVQAIVQSHLAKAKIERYIKP